MRERIGTTMRPAATHGNETGKSRRHRAGWRRSLRIVLAALLAVGVGAAASAQEPPGQDRFTMEEVRNGWIVAPDFKFTQIDDGDAVLAGAYGGRMIDGRLLVGGGAYWLSGAPDVNMAYGGGLVEWFGNSGGLVDFSVRGFVGLGTATLSSRFAFSEGWTDFGMFGSVDDIKLDVIEPAVSISNVTEAATDSFAGGKPDVGGGFYPVSEWDLSWHADPFAHRQNFLLAEPQVSIHLNVTSWLRVGGGAGYRLIGRGGGNTDRLRGFTANIGVQIGPR